MLREHTHICLCVILICIPWFQSGCDMLNLLFPLSKVDRRELISCFICLSTLKSFLPLKLKGSCQKTLKCGTAWNELVKPKPCLVGKLRKAGGIRSGSEVEPTKEWVDLPARFCPASRRQELPLRLSAVTPALPAVLHTWAPESSRASGKWKWLLLNCSRLWCRNHFLE